MQVTREIKHEPQPTSGYSSGASQSQKKRLLAKAQSECMLNTVATKKEPGLTEYHHGDYAHHSSCSSTLTACKDNVAATSSASYQYVATSSAGHPTTSQDQHIVYSGACVCVGCSGDKRNSWAPSSAHISRELLGPPSAHKRELTVPVSNSRDYVPQQAAVHKEFVQPPAAHSTASLSSRGGGGGGASTSEQQLKGWATTATTAQPPQQGYRHLSPQPPVSVSHRLSPLAAAAGQPLYHQPELYRRPAVYVTAAQPAAAAAYLPTGHQVAPFTTGRALPPPAHHASARPVLATHPSHPLPAHMQPTAVFPAHPQVAASYGFAPLSPSKTHQYQPSLWFTE